eukprot:scaffold6697_cov109-Skeletonema_dohrnii-CCMP3373.AAC.5
MELGPGIKAGNSNKEMNAMMGGIWRPPMGRDECPGEGRIGDLPFEEIMAFQIDAGTIIEGGRTPLEPNAPGTLNRC